MKQDRDPKGSGRVLSDLGVSLVFLTRLPLAPGSEGRYGELARACWSFPLVGLLVGLLSAGIGLLALFCGLTPWVAAVLALALGALVTGALHEDGLADMADGFGGGWTREQRLEIMRDSRIGSYGALALGVSLLLRAAALAGLAALDPLYLAAGLLAAHAGARALLLPFMLLTPLARREGQSVSAGRPGGRVVLVAVGLALLILAAAGLLLTGGLAYPLLACVSLAVTFLALRALACRQVGGYTGDVLGGLEQCGEAALLLAALALVS